jgi:hypothetical protein
VGLFDPKLVQRPLVILGGIEFRFAGVGVTQEVDVHGAIPAAGSEPERLS